MADTSRTDAQLAEATERIARLEATLFAIGVPYCRRCGCTDVVGCDEGCFWVAPDLCSSCVPEASRE